MSTSTQSPMQTSTVSPTASNTTARARPCSPSSEREAWARTPLHSCFAALVKLVAAGADPEHLQFQVDHLISEVARCAIESESSFVTVADLADRITASALAGVPDVRDHPRQDAPHVLLHRLTHGLTALHKIGVVGYSRRAGHEFHEFAYGRIKASDDAETITEDVQTTVEERRGLFVHKRVERDAITTEQRVTTTITYQQWTHRLQPGRKTRDFDSCRFPGRVERLVVSIPDWLGHETALYVAQNFQAVSHVRSQESSTRHITLRDTRERIQRSVNQDTLAAAGSIALTAGTAVGIATLGALAVTGLILATPVIGAAMFASHADPGLAIGPFVITGWLPSES